MIDYTKWVETEDSYGKYKERTNELGIKEVVVVSRTQKWHDENPIKQPEPQPPTDMELLQRENKLLKAQIKASDERADFHEEVLAEIIMSISQ